MIAGISADITYLKIEIVGYSEYRLAMPELMINVGWTDDETVNHYKPRFLHALNALSECKLDKPITTPEVVEMMDKPAAFNPTSYKTIRDTEADAI